MPSDIMMAVEFDWVTNARASDDYAGGSDNLLSMPHAALLMWSLGIRPSISQPPALYAYLCGRRPIYLPAHRGCIG
jgi:hypothetical protein